MLSYQTKLIPCKRKSISMRFCSPTELVVRYPWFANQNDVLKIVQKDRTKIEKLRIRFLKHLDNIQLRKASKQDISKLIFLGQNFEIKLVDIDNTKIDFVFKVIETNSIESLNFWLDLETKKLFEQRTKYWSAKINVIFCELKIKKLKSKWGSCSSKAQIVLNQRLIHAPLQILDYVIIHELCHLKHFDHSKQFWDLVRSFDKDFKSKKNWLKENQHEL